MGQENVKPASSNPRTPSKHNSLLNSARKAPIVLPRPQIRVECDGLLKLRTTPFKNSVQICIQNELLFLENVQTTLKQLLETRLHTNKLFMVEDIEKIIESLTFNIAFLQQKNITYRDISPEHIFYDNGCFKLLPNQLIEMSTYQRLKEDEETYAAPQLLIALKLGEESIEDMEILQKCNVFTLGMVMLEVTTLLPSCECYDLESYQILDQVLQERILMVAEYYGQKIAGIVANMLDYDYSQRMTMKQLSIWVNRELQTTKTPSSTPEHMGSSSIVGNKFQQRLTQTKTISSHNVSTMEKTTKKLTKNNSVYMGSNNQGQEQRQERNRIYVGEKGQPQPTKNHSFVPERSYADTRSQYVVQKNPRGFQKYANQNQRHLNQDDDLSLVKRVKNQLKHPNPYCDEFKFPKEEKFQKEVTKRITKESVNPYRAYCPEPRQVQEDSRQFQAESDRQSYPLKEVSNQYYPKIQDMIQSKSKIKQSGQVMAQNGAISRIKQQIVKSRRLLQQFRRNEHLKL